MLNEQSLEVLNLIKESCAKSVTPDDYVFINPITGSCYGEDHFICFIKKLHNEKKQKDAIGWIDRKTKKRITQHGFRSSFKTWSVSDELGNNKKFDPRVSEYCLLHGKNDPYKGGYDRCEFVVARRELMYEWGQWCWSLIDLNKD